MEIVKDAYLGSPSKQPKTTLTKAQHITLHANKKKNYKTKSIIYQGLEEATFKIIAS